MFRDAAYVVKSAVMGARSEGKAAGRIVNFGGSFIFCSEFGYGEFRYWFELDGVRFDVCKM